MRRSPVTALALLGLFFGAAVPARAEAEPREPGPHAPPRWSSRPSQSTRRPRAAGLTGVVTLGSRSPRPAWSPTRW
jgi:hypothetical protein